MGKCSFSENYANTNHMAWTTGIAGTVALNRAHFDDGKACGACIMYRGVGGGKGTTPLSTQYWAMGFVNNECPECEKGRCAPFITSHPCCPVILEWKSVFFVCCQHHFRQGQGFDPAPLTALSCNFSRYMSYMLLYFMEVFCSW
jgi:hypothetical protein